MPSTLIWHDAAGKDLRYPVKGPTVTSPDGRYRFVTPPGWPPFPPGRNVPAGWVPDPSWPRAPEGWTFWEPIEPALASAIPAPPSAASPVAAAAAPVQSSQPYVLPDVHPDRWYQKKIVVFPAFALLILVIMGVISAARSGPDYKGSDLQTDVTRTLHDNGISGDLSVTCPDVPKVAKGEIADCRAALNGTTSGIRVTFDDDKGHFTVQEQSLP